MKIQNMVTTLRLILNTHIVAQALRRITIVLIVTRIAATISKLSTRVKKNAEQTRQSKKRRTCHLNTAYYS